MELIRRMKRIICRILYYHFAIYLPPSFEKGGCFSKRIREALVRNFISYCGRNVNIEKGAIFTSDTKIGNNSGIGIKAELTGKVIIGDNVMMGPHCIIYTKNHKTSDISIPMCLQGFEEEEPVIIEDDVWIGGRVVILPGVRVGRGTIIGVGSVVTRDVAPFSVVGGVPAKLIKMRE